MAMTRPKRRLADLANERLQFSLPGEGGLPTESAAKRLAALFIRACDLPDGKRRLSI